MLGWHDSVTGGFNIMIVNKQDEKKNCNMNMSGIIGVDFSSWSGFSLFIYKAR